MAASDAVDPAESFSADVVVVGGGHNGLVAAILAAQAGRSVVLLERGDHVGGATVGARVFAGQPARLSRYSYLVSLFPDELLERLGVTLDLRSRGVSSYTPLLRGDEATGLLVERTPGAASAESFRAVTGSDDDWLAWQKLYAELGVLAAAVAPALLGPLWPESEVREAVLTAFAAAPEHTVADGEQLWRDVVERPIGEMIRRRFRDDVVRGIVATDALIGTYTSLDDPSLLANRCFLYHLIGRGTGEWLVPAGGMGALTDALLARAQALGVQVVTSVEVTGVVEDSAGVSVVGELAGVGSIAARGEHVLAGVAPAVLDSWRGLVPAAPVGAQLKINMLLDRLPALKSGADPTLVFAGTTHLEESYTELEEAYRLTSQGSVPEYLPAEVYCHSLTDPTILHGFSGHTLTLFGLHAPATLFLADPAGAKQRFAQAALASLQRHLAEPLEDCLARDAGGWLCVDIASPLDLEETLAMPGGHIFHGDLQWPWLAADGVESQPGRPSSSWSQRYGVAVAGSSRILLAGSGSRRGGAVSGLGGAAAVDALLAAAQGDSP